ncbi:excinuclease ABC subunit C [Chryseotalea sanaruensis]|uniref:UvrABC system protein C n=1 Tax=Chryseotalea sanaruensis TaxID=2482724 RepID=A0A401U7A5_9BACT|nr:excinuclease ABC subunit UvrC [Chryseotalea sanaruensis]GCC50767.1 excinuclease ABC subunit C [Chryseotalea sanaruensis]
MNDESARALINILPESPGVYRYYNDVDVLIYVGKAKNIRKRVSSYFSKTAGISRKTLKLVSEIERIEYTVSNNEFDALLLENNLIKQNQPKYNILLKDDKTFPYLCILKERFPRIIYTRKYIPQQGEYFGPFSSVVAMKSVLELVQKLYAIRTCSLLLSEQNIKSEKFKVCLEFHLGNCKGPCVGNQQEHDYLEDIAQARHILKGNLSIVAHYFQEQMEAFAAAMNFERAQFFKEKILLLEKYQSKSLVVNRAITDVDVITLVSNDNTLYINFLLLKEGAIIFSKTVFAQKRVDEADEEVLSTVAQELREQANSQNKIILSNIPLSFVAEGVENTVPQIGDKKKLITLSVKNALELKREKEISKEGRKTKNREVLEILQSDLQLKTLPIVIECFDNSNFQGTSPVASMVRFVDGKPDKKGYRHFNIKTVEGPNDFASMKEIVGRRYKRLIEEQTALPDLIIVDGGKGQLSSAVEALKELSVYGRVPIAGIAKRLEEIYLPEDTLPLLINKKSPGLRLIQQMRDEAHRFAITFHRLKRSKVNSSSSLEEIEGLGKKTAEKLLKHFKSLKKVKAASVEELTALVGPSIAEKIKQVQ